mgnify:CR=1 FL=1
MNPNLLVRDSGASLKVLFIDNTVLERNKRFTFLTEDVIAAGTTIRVQNILGFESVSTSSGQVLIIGKVGNERTEIRRTTNASADGYPSETYKEIGLRDSLKFDHPQDTQITITDWDRVEFDYATSVTGTKTTIFAYPATLQPDMLQTLARDVTEPTNRLGQTTAFYFARFNSTIDSRNSDWSDAVYGTGYDDNTVFAIKKRAIDELGEEIDGKIITHEFLNQCLWEARREYHKSPGKRPFRRKFNADIGNALTGSARIELPTDVEKPYSAENIYGVRIGANANMEFYDKKEWDFDYRNVPHSTLDVPYTRGTSTSIWLASGRDFSGSPTISVEGMNISATRITGSQNSFTITTHGSYPSASAGSDAWENASYGLPDKFTVFADPEGSAYIYFNRPIDTAYVDMNIYSDYYRTLVGYNSDGDVLDENSYDMYVDYLKAKIKQRKARGEMDLVQDSDYKLWMFKKAENLANEYLSADIRISPDVSHLNLPS